MVLQMEREVSDKTWMDEQMDERTDEQMENYQFLVSPGSRQAFAKQKRHYLVDKATGSWFVVTRAILEPFLRSREVGKKKISIEHFIFWVGCSNVWVGRKR